MRCVAVLSSDIPFHGLENAFFASDADICLVNTHQEAQDKELLVLVRFLMVRV